MRVGDEFTYRYADLHTSTQRVVEVVPEKRVVWEVTDANLSFAEHPREWVGTRVVFDIARKGGQTQLSFTHEGLTPACDCYEACQGGWAFYVEKSLKSLIQSGKGLRPPWE